MDINNIEYEIAKIPDGFEVYSPDYTHKYNPGDEVGSLDKLIVRYVYSTDKVPFYIEIDDANNLNYTIDIINRGNLFIYSEDNKNWSDFSSPLTTVRNKSKIYFCGDLKDFSTDDDEERVKFKVTKPDGTNAKFNIGGYAISLINGDPTQFDHTKIPEKVFKQLFEGTDVKDTTNLHMPDVTNNYCYEEMFSGCEELENMPMLNAPTLSEGCYENMFLDCINLKIVKQQQLPATELKERCYFGMFKGCTSLTDAPQLGKGQGYPFVMSGYSGTDIWLGESCCAEMFCGCTSLSAVQESFFVKNTAEWCFSNMFENCSALSGNATNIIMSDEKEGNVPLPKILAVGACFAMFQNCSSLTKASIINATDIGEHSCQQMFNDCTSLKDARPALSAATKIDDYSYASMFYGCTNLETFGPDELDYETLNMKVQIFPYNSGLTKLGMESCSNMFSNCTKITNQYEGFKLRNVELGGNCCSGMFRNCNFHGIILEPQNLETGCYDHMFSCDDAQRRNLRILTISANKFEGYDPNSNPSSNLSVLNSLLAFNETFDGTTIHIDPEREEDCYIGHTKLYKWDCSEASYVQKIIDDCTQIIYDEDYDRNLYFYSLYLYLKGMNVTKDSSTEEPSFSSNSFGAVLFNVLRNQGKLNDWGSLWPRDTEKGGTLYNYVWCVYAPISNDRDRYNFLGNIKCNDRADQYIIKQDPNATYTISEQT